MAEIRPYEGLLDPQMAALLKATEGEEPEWVRQLGAVRSGMLDPSVGIPAARRIYDAESQKLSLSRAELAKVVDLKLGDRRTAARLYLPIRSPSSPGLHPAVLFLHGGSWMLGSIDSHDSLCRHVAARSGCGVVSLEYSLAPEHPFPAGLEDCIDAFRGLMNEATHLGIDPDRFGLAGDSAGANIVAAATLSLRSLGAAAPKCLLLIYPSVDSQMTSRSWDELGDAYRLKRADTEWWYQQYAQSAEQRGSDRVSPILAKDLSDFPPTYIQTAELDPLRDEAEEFGRRLAAANVDVVIERFRGVIHGFVRFEQLEQAQSAIDHAAEWIKQALG